MGYVVKSNDKGRGVLMLALLLGLVFFGVVTGPTAAQAVAITCGQCHSNPPSDTDGCKAIAKNHAAHSSSDTATCARCHIVPATKVPSAKHNNNIVNITSVVAAGMRYNTSTAACTKACHKNQDSTWGGTLSCNSCHFRTGATAGVTMSGLHVDATRTWKHYSSPVVCNGKKITCTACHKNRDNDNTTPRQHIASTTFEGRADLSQAHTYVNVTGTGYIKGATPADGTCVKSCHYNPTDPYGNYTICFKPGQKKRFGAYKSAKWNDTDLLCNECHSTPGDNATFGGLSTVRANKRHADHMFKYKLNPYNFAAQDRNIYCDDCHRTPDINAVRGFQHHSTIGAAGNGIISLPIKSRTSKVYMQWRNNGKGRDGLTAPLYDKATTGCSNVYCHTIMVSGTWTEEACNACHGQKDGTNLGSGAPGYANWTTRAQFRTFESYSGGGGAHYSHVTRRGYACRECHYDGGGDGNPANHHNVLQRTVKRENVNVGVAPQWWFNNKTSFYDLNTRACSNVSCHYGASQNWDCEPLH